MLWWTIQKLRSSNWKVRAEAARTLAASGRPKAVPPLIKALKDAVGEERPAVIEALGALGHEAAVGPLISALQDQPQRLKSLRGKSASAEDAAEYKPMAEALAKIGAASLNPLVGLLGSADKDVRRWAAYGLGLLRDPRALDALAGYLQDSRSEVRQAAARALGSLGDPRVLQPLIKVLSGRDPETRSAAAEALGMLGSEDAVDPLAAAARDPNEPLQLAAIESLRKIGGLKAGGRIRAVMETAKKSVREAAAAALASMTINATGPGDRAAAAVLRGNFDAALREGPLSAAALISALGSRDAGHRLKAVGALRTLRSESALPALLAALDDNERMVQQAAAAALADLGAAALPGLFECLRSEHLSVRGLAAESLRTIGNSRAAGPLIDALSDLRGRLRNESGAPEAAQSAAGALAEILSNSAPHFSEDDLARLTALGNRAAARGAAPLQEARPAEEAAEIGRISELARRELERRGSR